MHEDYFPTCPLIKAANKDQFGRMASLPDPVPHPDPNLNESDLQGSDSGAALTMKLERYLLITLSLLFILGASMAQPTSSVTITRVTPATPTSLPWRKLNPWKGLVGIYENPVLVLKAMQPFGMTFNLSLYQTTKEQIAEVLNALERKKPTLGGETFEQEIQSMKDCLESLTPSDILDDLPEENQTEMRELACPQEKGTLISNDYCSKVTNTTESTQDVITALADGDLVKITIPLLITVRNMINEFTESLQKFQEEFLQFKDGRIPHRLVQHFTSDCVNTLQRLHCLWHDNMGLINLTPYIQVNKIAKSQQEGIAFIQAELPCFTLKSIHEKYKLVSFPFYENEVAQKA